MALDKRTFRLAFTALLALVFTYFTGCSESLQPPFAPASDSIDAGMDDGRGAPSDATLNDGITDARSGRILATRDGEFLTPDDITLQYNPDDLPPGIEPRIVFADPTYFQFTILPPGIETRHPVKVVIDYSKADLEGIDREDLEVWGVGIDDYTPYVSANDTSNSEIGFKTTRFSRYALARD